MTVLMRSRVLTQMKEDIINCSLNPGEELREADLAERYNVSKSPVRDALQHLAYEGLIETMPRRGHRVVPLSISDAKDMLEMRETLEVAAARMISEKATAADLESLDTFRNSNASSIDEFAAYNHCFHNTIAVMSGNRRLADDMRRLLDAYYRLCLFSLSRVRETDMEMKVPLADHCDIIDALQARDARRATRATQRHIRHSRGQILRGLENRPIVD